MNTELIPVVLAGGAGTRLWPLSRRHHPKQLLALGGGDTLIQQTVLRLEGLPPELGLGPPIVVCNENQGSRITAQLDAVGHRPEHLILEPMGRNTAPALGLAAAVAGRDGRDPLLLVLPSDHVIEDWAALHAAIEEAARSAKDSAVVTFGVVPTRPETGYGYIKVGPLATGASTHCIDRFVEKPPADTAAAYVASGNYLWNAGMFLVRASVWGRALVEHAPDVASACAAALSPEASSRQCIRPQAAAFAAAPSVSIDVAVMEKLDGTAAGTDEPWGAVVPLDAGWTDLGSWSAVYDSGPHDENGNVAAGDVWLAKTNRNLVLSRSRLVAVLGLDDVVVVETADAVLVAAKAAAQDVGGVPRWLDEQGRAEAREHRAEECAYGRVARLDDAAGGPVLRHSVRPGAATEPPVESEHAKHWVVLAGMADVTCDGNISTLAAPEGATIPAGAVHALSNPGPDWLEVFEFQMRDNGAAVAGKVGGSRAVAGGQRVGRA